MAQTTHGDALRGGIRLTALASTAALGLTALTGVVAVPDARAAGHPSHDVIVSPNPFDLTPDVLNGHVDAFAQIGQTMVVGGLFTTVSTGGQTYHRRNIFAFDVATGAMSTTFRPKVNGEVFALLASRDRTAVYLAGAFTTVNHHEHTGRIARVKVATGAVDGRFRSPGVNDAIRDLGFAAGRYYISGYFTKVGGHSRQYIAALDATGRDTGRASLRFSGTNRDGRTHIRTMDIAPGGKSIVVAGNFMRVNGRPRAQLAMLHVGRKDTTLSRWSTTRLRPQCGRHFDSYPRDVAFAPNGRYFVLVTTGGPKGMQASGLLCDSATRWNVRGGPGRQPAWVDYTGGDTLSAVIVDRNVVYVGGHQRYLNNSFGHNDAARGAVSRPGIAALDPVNGLPYEWNPGRPRGVGVFGMALTKGGLWIGHDTAKFDGEPRQRIALCPAASGSPLPPNHTSSLPGQLTLLGPRQQSGAVARDFDGQDLSNAHPIPTGSPWDQVRGSFVVDGILFAGWSDGTMTAQTFDGHSFGGQLMLTLRHAFNDLPQVGAMFFDRKTHRIYYTHAGSNRLYYRYFTPESRIVGTWRYAVGGSSTIDWGRVGGAFVVGTTLYYLDQPSHTLRRVGWNGATAKAVGEPTVVAGPSVDNVSYRAHGAVLTD
jgi:hypothetical protein